MIDVNPKEIYDEGHVPGARWMHFDKADPSVLPRDKATPVVLYCFNPVYDASHQAATAVLRNVSGTDHLRAGYRAVVR